MKPFKMLLKISLIAIVIAVTAFSVNAQQDSLKSNQPDEVVSLNKIRVNFIGLAFEREQKIGKTTTFYGGAGAEGLLLVKNTTQLTEISSKKGMPTYQLDTKSSSKFYVFPAVNLGLRHYYNFASRVKKGKNTTNNAAAYFGLDVTSYFPTQTNEVDYQINIGPMWGFQSNVVKKVNFELSLGPGVAITSESTEFQVLGKLGFSFLL